jgi:hypothetical protein
MTLFIVIETVVFFLYGWLYVVTPLSPRFLVVYAAGAVLVLLGPTIERYLDQIPIESRRARR